jgi:hypothetical protein
MDAALEGSETLKEFGPEDLRGALLELGKLRTSTYDQNTKTWTKNTEVLEARERAIECLFPGMLTVIQRATKRTPNPEPEATARYLVTGKGPAAKIRIAGFRNDKVYDRTFTIGETVAVGSYNLTYTGPIEAIGPKTVTVRAHGRLERQEIYEFTYRNYDLDLAQIARENHETSMCI